LSSARGTAQCWNVQDMTKIPALWDGDFQSRYLRQA
jgi:hypothetical protein